MMTEAGGDSTDEEEEEEETVPPIGNASAKQPSAFRGCGGLCGLCVCVRVFVCCLL
jgi:hypothetical protein